MTRFKELQPIETAIEHENAADLEWAIGYCKMRLQLAQRKDQKEILAGYREKNAHCSS